VGEVRFGVVAVVDVVVVAGSGAEVVEKDDAGVVSNAKD